MTPPTGGTPGELALVLHTHLPWVRGFGTWPVGEEWLFQAWAESWYPVTEVAMSLAEDGLREVLTLSVTPTVAAQVHDQRLRDDLGAWIAGQRWRAEEQRQWGRAHAPWLAELAPFHWRHFDHLLDVHARIEAAGGLLAVWSDLAARGVVQVLAGPASHAYLPLLTDPRSVDHQLGAGIRTHADWVGTPPRGLWPPELGYRPRGPVAEPSRVPHSVDRHGTPTLPVGDRERPGLEEHYAAWGIDHVLVDGPTLVAAAGGGAGRNWTTRPPVAPPGSAGDVVYDGVLVGESDVAAFGRDLAVAYRVWSPTAGYPGHPAYRDFHAVGGWNTHRSWRVTDRALDVADKQPWEPDATAAVVRAHVDDFHDLVRRGLDPRPGAVVVAAFDTELYGHWWHEGPVWLEAVLRRLADDPAVRLTTLASRLDRRPPVRRLHLPESSWGWGKGHGSWVAPGTRWMWERIRRREARVLATLEDVPAETHDLLLAEFGQLAASDWPFMVTWGQTAEYAAERVGRHDRRLGALLAAAEAGRAVQPPDPPSPWAAVTSTPADPDDMPAASAGPITTIDRPLRILEVAWEYPPVMVGGLGRHVAALVAGLARADHDVTLVTRGRAGVPARATVDGVEVIRVDPPRGLDRRDRLVEWMLDLGTRLAAEATRAARTRDFDVVHVHDWVVATTGIGLWETLDLPLVATVHATERGRHLGFLPGATSRWIHQAEWWLATRADRVLVCSAAMREEVQSSFAVPSERLARVPNGVDLGGFHDRIDPLHWAATRQRFAPDGQHLVTFVGRLEHEKGVDTMVDAMPDLQRRAGPVRLVVAGRGSQGDPLRERVRRLGLADAVTFPGFLPEADLHALYAAADVVVVPSRYEPFGLVALEAVACGAAVVVADTGGLGELARAGVGVAAPPEDTMAWAMAVGGLLVDPGRARDVVRRGQAVARDCHDWDQVATATADVLRAAVADHDRAGRDHDLRRELWASPLLDLAAHA